MTTPARNALGRFAASGTRRGRRAASTGRFGGSVGGGHGGKGAWLDDRVLTERLREYVKRSGKSIPVALNKAGRSACFRAIRKTPKTKMAQITADVGTVQHPKSGAQGAYALYLFKHPGLRGAALKGLKAKVQRMIAVKRASVAYIAAGFFRALRAFAQTAKDVTPQSIAARGYGKKATTQQKFSEVMNAAPGADEMAAQPLAEASVEALDDMMDYLDRQQQSAAKSFNR